MVYFNLLFYDDCQVSGIIHDCMVQAAPLRVPLQVKLFTGHSWGKLEPYQPPPPVPLQPTLKLVSAPGNTVGDEMSQGEGTVANRPLARAIFGKGEDED